MPDISIIMPTARDNYCIQGQPDLHFLKPTMESLSKQSFKDFELILVDSLYPTRDYGFSGIPFPVKHVPVHPNHRFWLNRKRWNVCGALNTGIIHAEGDLIVRIDDASQFGSDFLQRFWDGYQSGYFPLAMHTRYRGGRQAFYNDEYRQEGYDFAREEPDRKRILEQVYGEGNPIRDTRWPIVEGKGGRMIGPPEWFYGYSSMSLEDALKVNGFNELFDGDKGQEDQEMGLRLSMAGYRDMFLLDIDHWVIEHEHHPIPAEVITPDQGNIKCNYSIFLLNKRKGRWRANSDRLTKEDLDFIIDESLRPPCSPHPNFYIDDCQGKLFKLWSDNPPLFDLRDERLEI